MKEILRTISRPQDTEETFVCENNGCGNPVSKHSMFKCLKCKCQIVFYLKAKGVPEYPSPIIYKKFIN